MYIDGWLAPNNFALVSPSRGLGRAPNNLELVSPSSGFVAVAKFPHLRGSEDFVGADVWGAAVGAGVLKAEAPARGGWTGGEPPGFFGVAAAAGAIPRNPDSWRGDGLRLRRRESRADADRALMMVAAPFRKSRVSRKSLD